MTDLNTLPRADLTARYNELTGKDIKPTSYTKGKLIELITEHQAEIDANEASSNDEPNKQELIDAAAGRMANELFAEFDETPEVEETPETLTCPLCGANTHEEPAFEKVGEEGSFLGACLRCPTCEKVFNKLTGAEVPSPKASKKRKILNPQPTIDRKTTHLAEEVKATLYYDREERLWFIEPNGYDDDEGIDLIPLTSRELSENSKEDLVEMVQKAAADLAARRAG